MRFAAVALALGLAACGGKGPKPISAEQQNTIRSYQILAYQAAGNYKSELLAQWAQVGTLEASGPAGELAAALSLMRAALIDNAQNTSGTVLDEQLNKIRLQEPSFTPAQRQALTALRKSRVAEEEAKETLKKINQRIDQVTEEFRKADGCPRCSVNPADFTWVVPKR